MSKDFVPYLLRQQGERMFHIGLGGAPLCGAVLTGPADRFYLPPQLGMAHGVCADCRNMYERNKLRLPKFGEDK